MDKQLLDYVKNVVDLEKSIYVQDQAINSLEDEIKMLGCSVSYEYPQSPPKRTLEVKFGRICSSLWYGAIFGAIIGIFTFGWRKGALLGGLGFVVIPIIFDIVIIALENSENKKEYNAQMSQYQQLVRNDLLRVQKEKKEKEKLQQMLSMMRRKRAETADLRQQYYDVGVIYNDYRNLVAICSIYGYLASERCPGLTGWDGAYNKFDEDVHRGKVEKLLEQAVEKLDEIRDSQHLLYDAIQEGNRISHMLVSNSIKQLQLAEITAENTALGAHYQQQQLQEARQTKNLIAYEQWYRRYKERQRY